MKLSVITINFNNKLGLAKTINSVISQVYRDFEWIVIDGGSTDGSADVIAELSKNSRANISYWCSEKDGGIYNAMNKGIAHVHGDYVCFMNSGDCFFDDNILKKVMIYLEQGKADVLYGDVSFEYGDHSDIKMFPKTLTFRWLYNDTLNHQATFCKRDMLRKFMFDESYKIMADRKLWLQLYLDGSSFKYIHQTITKYDHTGLSWSNGDAWLKDFQRLHNEFIPLYIQKNSILTKLYKVSLEIKSRVKRLIR